MCSYMHISMCSKSLRLAASCDKCDRTVNYYTLVQADTQKQCVRIAISKVSFWDVYFKDNT